MKNPCDISDVIILKKAADLPKRNIYKFTLPPNIDLTGRSLRSRK
jgi:hypothetical protein